MGFHYTDDPVFDAERYDTYMNKKILEDKIQERDELEEQLEYETDDEEIKYLKHKIKELDEEIEERS